MSRALIAHQVARTPDRFSRVLSQSNPSVRSSNARIVPMNTPQRTHPADVVVGCACAFGGVALIILFSLGVL
jgi:hypothetical protein